MKEQPHIILTGDNAEAAKLILAIIPLAKQCVESEKRNLANFPIHKNGRAPVGRKGVLIPGKPRLMAEFVADTGHGWMGAVDCKEFREWVFKTTGSTIEKIIGVAQ